MKKPAGPYRCINVKMEKMPEQRAQGGMGLEQAIIDIRNMYKIYNPGENEVRALDGVSLAVYKGEFVAIVGHSGSGKSTLMNMIGCLDTPTSGTYFLNGQDVSALSDNALSAIRNEQIGFIFQSFNLIKNLNALENVELPLIYRGLPAGKRRLLALEALERVGLASRMDHRPNQMSGGQQQRVAVARAIAAHPPLILADEPTGNLDTRAGARVFEIIRAPARCFCSRPNGRRKSAASKKSCCFHWRALRCWPWRATPF